MASANRLLMQSPSPVPPNFRREDELSTWLKGRKSPCCCSSLMPMPVSVTSKRRRGEPPSPGEPGGDADFALIRELDRVAHQVHQHLPETQRIGQHDRRGRGPVSSASSLSCLASACVRASARRVREQFDGEQRICSTCSFSRFHFGEVEDVVDQSQEVLAVTFDRCK